MCMVDINYASVTVLSLPVCHAVHKTPEKALYVFAPGKRLAGYRKPLKLSKVNVNVDDIFIIFKEGTQQGLISLCTMLTIFQ